VISEQQRRFALPARACLCCSAPGLGAGTGLGPGSFRQWEHTTAGAGVLDEGRTLARYVAVADMTGGRRFSYAFVGKGGWGEAVLLRCMAVADERLQGPGCQHGT